MEEQTLPNLDIKDFQSISSAQKLDSILMVLSNGLGAKVTIDLLIKILLRDIQPSINEAGEWVIGNNLTGLVAVGKNPFLQTSENGIEWKYEDETSFRPLVSYDVLKLKFEDMTPEQIQAITGGKGDKGDVGGIGPTGKTGKSAYTIAAENGYSGTEQQFGTEQAAIAANSARLTTVETNKQDKPIAGRTFLTPLFVARGAVYNNATGFYELNGITDITEAQMMDIYSYTSSASISALIQRYVKSPIITNFKVPYTSDLGIYFSLQGCFYQCSSLKVINLTGSAIKVNSLNYCFTSCRLLVKIADVLNIANITVNDGVNSAFFNCNILETVYLFNLKVSILFSSSPNLTRESIMYIIENAANTSPITLTLHATAKDRLTPEDIALAVSKNITIA